MRKNASTRTRARRSGRQPAATVRQVASLLLTYPDQGLMDQLGLLRAAVDELSGDVRASLSDAVEHVAATPLGEQQRQYVATFDLKKKCCPYLTWWVHGDTRNRGYALVAFKTAYRDAGMQPPSGELPDHLAVVLEFAATIDPSAGEKLLADHRPALELLRQALHKASSPYAGVLDAVCTTLPGSRDDAVATARRIAATGPPAELVGLEPYQATPSNLDPSAVVNR